MTCPDCGHRNEPDAQFCASCRAFLEWTRSAEPTGQGAGAAPPAGTGRPPGPGTPAARADTPTPEQPPHQPQHQPQPQPQTQPHPPDQPPTSAPSPATAPPPGPADPTNGRAGTAPRPAR
ncbi:hypothetical protein AAHZ94_34915, partial [Streptomyces sp. HSW2009]